MDPFEQLKSLASTMGDLQARFAEAAERHADEGVRQKLREAVQQLQESQTHVLEVREREMAIAKQEAQRDEALRAARQARKQALQEKRQKATEDAKQAAAAQAKQLDAQLAADAIGPQLGQTLRDELLQWYGNLTAPPSRVPRSTGEEWTDWLNSAD